MLSKFCSDLSVRINASKKNIQSIRDLDEYIGEFKNVNFYAYLMQQEGCFDADNIVNELEALKFLVGEKKLFANLKNLFISYHGYNLVKGIFEDKAFIPKLSVCTAMANQYILDYRGDIYKCWWSMGMSERKIGKYKENLLFLEKTKVNSFTNRKVNNISKCSICKYRYVCGGGCTGVMSNKELVSSPGKCPDFEGILKYMIKKEYEVL